MLIKKQTHSLIKLVFINKVIASSPDCNIKKTQQGPNQSEKLIKTEELFFLSAHVECWTAMQVKGVSLYRNCGAASAGEYNRVILYY